MFLSKIEILRHVSSHRVKNGKYKFYISCINKPDLWIICDPGNYQYGYSRILFIGNDLMR